MKYKGKKAKTKTKIKKKKNTKTASSLEQGHGYTWKLYTRNIFKTKMYPELLDLVCRLNINFLWDLEPQEENVTRHPVWNPRREESAR